MSEDIYAKPDLTKKVRFQAGKKDVCDDIDNVRIYDNEWAEESTPQDKPQDNNTEDEQQTASVSVSSGNRNLLRVAAMLLGLLCLLLVAVIILVALFIIERSQLRDELQTSYSQMRSLNHNLTSERDRLQTNSSQMRILNHNLTSERDELQTNYSQMRILNHNLTQNTNQLEIKISKLTRERDELQQKIVKSWTESEESCDEKDAKLVIISSQEEQEFIMLLNRRTWIGLTDKEREGKWKWVDGTEVKHPVRYWNDGQPDDGASDKITENCAHMSNSDYINNWNDLRCSIRLNFICEKSLG